MRSVMPFSIRPLRDADTAAVRSLWADRFGVRDAIATSWLDAALDPKHSVRGHVAVCRPDRGESASPVVGFGLFDVAGPSYTRDYLGLDVLDVAFTPAPRTGIFHMYCVRTSWEGRGVGTALFARHRSVCRDEHVPQAVGIAWRREHHPDSRALFDAFGFHRLATVDLFYDRVAPRVHCPDCNGPCTCAATLYVRSIRVP